MSALRTLIILAFNKIFFPMVYPKTSGCNFMTGRKQHCCYQYIQDAISSKKETLHLHKYILINALEMPLAKHYINILSYKYIRSNNTTVSNTLMAGQLFRSRASFGTHCVLSRTFFPILQRL
jgi:hypothetical protein